MLHLCFLLVAGQQVGGRVVIRPDRLPRLHATPSVLRTPKLIPGGRDAPLHMPPGFHASVFARGLYSPRTMVVAPNGDVFVTESYQGRIKVLRDSNGDGKADSIRVFAGGLNLPHGLLLHGNYLYVGETTGVVRFPYQPGQRHASGRAEPVLTGLPSRGYHQHWTRSIAFSPDGHRLFVTVGSETDDDPEPPPRGTILVADADGKNRRVFADGIRNPVGIAFRPGTDELWFTGIERDHEGDDLVPDFFAQVHDGDWFGWPWFYSGSHRDPYPGGKPPKGRVPRTPDVLLTAHSIPIGLLFYTGSQFPPEYRGCAFLAMRGSTNRSWKSGYEIAVVRFQGGHVVPGYEHFALGWCPDPRRNGVYGRPAGLAQWSDGSMLVADEGGNRIYRIRYSPDRR